MHGWRVEAVPVHVLYHDLVRQPDAEGKLRVERERGGERLLGEHGRMPRIGRNDRRAHLNAVDAAARDGESGQRVESEDVGHPGR